MIGPTVLAVPDPLVPLGGELAGIGVDAARAVGRVVLALAEGDRHEQPRSTLNNDGSPLQLCVSASQSRRTVRLLGDPTGLMAPHAHADGERRFTRARQAVSRLLSFANCTALHPACECLLQMLLPEDADSMATMAGPLWLAAGLGCPGVALYVNARRGPIEGQWERVTECLRVMLPGDAATRALAALTLHALPASVGLEGTRPDDARVKVYCRLRRATSLDALACPLFLDPTLVEFLEVTLSQRSIRASGLVFAAGFALADGQLQDVKIDVCAHCLPLAAEEWLGVIERLTTANNLAEMGVSLALRSGTVDVALLGFGVDGSGQRRLNLYLKAPSR